MKRQNRSPRPNRMATRGQQRPFSPAVVAARRHLAQLDSLLFAAGEKASHGTGIGAASVLEQKRVALRRRGHAQAGMSSLERYAFPRLVKYTAAVINTSLGIILWI